MSKSQRRPQQIFLIVMWMLSVIFAACLIGIGGLIIKDLPRVDQSLTVEAFTDQAAMTETQIKEDQLQTQILSVERTLDVKQDQFAEASNSYFAAKATFDNWILTRNATQSSTQDAEVLDRTRKLEALKQVERTALGQLETTRQDLRNLEREMGDVRARQFQIRQDAQPEYAKARQSQELRVFLYRLALTLPLLLAAGWMAAKKRESAYWPLYRGFILFALFAFFVELVPYLPSYGGYVRYGVGILVVLISGHFIIRGMRRYIERKQIEESRSEAVRRQSIQYETALKKIAAKTCPGCDRSIIQREGVDTDFCVHCGIRLQRECGSCGTRNISFHKFCLCCGVQTPELGDPAQTVPLESPNSPPIPPAVPPRPGGPVLT